MGRNKASPGRNDLGSNRGWVLWLMRGWALIGLIGFLIPYGRALYSTIAQNLSVISLAAGTFVFSQRIDQIVPAAVLLLLPLSVFALSILRKPYEKRFGYAVAAVLAVCVLLCNHAVKQETVTQCAEYGYIFQPGMGYYALLAFGWGILISSAFMLLLPYQRPFFLSARRAEEDWER